MTTRASAPHAPLAAVVLSVCLVVLACAFAPAAFAVTYRDVATTQWARNYILWVTAQQYGAQRLMDDYGGTEFKPSEPVTRAQLARALVLAGGRQNDTFTPVDLSDVPADHPYYKDIQIAVKLSLVTPVGGEFRPGAAALVWEAHRGAVLATRLRFPTQDWSMLRNLSPRIWRPDVGWSTGAPSYFATEIAARYLGYRFNHPYGSEALEMSPTEPIRRDEMAVTLYRILHMTVAKVYGLRRFDVVQLPVLSARQKQILSFAFRYEGYPYVYAGEYPTNDSPYGYQDHGGFDCSGFTWWVMKITFGYPIPVTQRSAAQMAAGTRTHLKRTQLRAGDIIFFGPNGPQSAASSIYHAALYMGNGWFIHSTGSVDGVSLASLDWAGWGWNTDFAWGRRLLTATDLSLTTPTPTPTPTPTATPTPTPTPSG